LRQTTEKKKAKIFQNQRSNSHRKKEQKNKIKSTFEKNKQRAERSQKQNKKQRFIQNKK